MRRAGRERRCAQPTRVSVVIDAADAEQPAQRHEPGGLVVHQVGVFLEDLVPAAPGRVLQLEHGLRVEQVRLTLTTPLVVTAGLQPPVIEVGAPGREGPGVPGRDLGGQHLEADTAEPGGGAGEGGADDLLAEPDGLEDLRPGVGGDGGDTHLGHDLQQALAQGLDQVLRGLLGGDSVKQAAADHVLDGLQGEVWVDRGGAVADKQRDVVALAGVAGLHDQPGPRPGPRPDQVMMHGAGEQQRRDRRQGRLGQLAAPAVGQHDDVRAAGDRGGHLGADLVEPVAQRGTAALDVVPAVHHMGGEAGQVAVVVDVDDLVQLIAAEDGEGQHDLAAGRRARFEQVAFRAGGGFQRGHQLLPDRVQRRVGDLGEQLGEVVEDQPGTVGEHGDRGVGAHRPDRLGAGPGHRGEQDAQVFLGVAEHPLLGGQLRRGRQAGGPVGQVVQVQQAGVQPVLVRVLAGQRGLHVRVLQDPPPAGVGQEDAAGLEAALADHVRRVDVEHADLAGQHHEPVAGHPVPAGAQPVAVEHRPDHGPVGERHAGRAVPRLHEGGVEAVEGAPGGIHPVVVLPRLGDHHQHGVRQRPATEVQQFQALVEARRVAAGLIQDRQQPLHAAPVRGPREQVAGQHGLAGPHPVPVPPDRVDLPVVRDVAVRVGQRPGRERVGRKPRVDQGQSRDVAGVGQVRVERLELQRGEHALVTDGARGQRDDVAVGLVFHPLAQAVRAPVQRNSAFTRRRNENLAQRRQHVPGPTPAVLRVIGGVAPAEGGQAFLGGEPLHHHGSVRAGLIVSGQEHHPGRVAARRGKLEAAHRAEERIGDLGQDAGSVARVRVAALGAAVLEVTEHGQGLGYGVVGRHPGQIGHEADATRIVFEAGVVEPSGIH